MSAIRVCRVLSAVLLSAGFASALPLCAQSASDSSKVLVINREVTKPGRDGASHEATEAAFVRAVQANKANIHYIALTSVSGQNRALFLSGYPSLAAFEEERKGLSAAALTAMDKAMVADGDLLSEQTTSVLIRRDDLSTNVSGPPVGMRMMEITQFVVKPGHEHEFDELAKMYVDAVKDIPEMHWTTYEMTYGSPIMGAGGSVYVVLTALKSGADADAEFAAGKRVDEALGEEKGKKMSELASASIQSEMTNLFVVSPKMSIPTDAMVAAEPDFWRPKAMASAAKKTAAKPVVASGQ